MATKTSKKTSAKKTSRRASSKDVITAAEKRAAKKAAVEAAPAPRKLSKEEKVVAAVLEVPTTAAEFIRQHMFSKTAAEVVQMAHAAGFTTVDQRRVYGLRRLGRRAAEGETPTGESTFEALTRQLGKARLSALVDWIAADGGKGAKKMLASAERALRAELHQEPRGVATPPGLTHISWMPRSGPGRPKQRNAALRRLYDLVELGEAGECLSLDGIDGSVSARELWLSPLPMNSTAERHVAAARALRSAGEKRRVWLEEVRLAAVAMGITTSASAAAFEEIMRRALASRPPEPDAEREPAPRGRPRK